MERYSSYKPTSMQWIKEIPSHWEIEPFARHFSYGKGLPITKANLTTHGIAVISYGQVHSKLNKGTTITENLVRYVSPNYIKSHPQCLLNKGDFVFADTSEDIEGSGNFAFNDYKDSIFAGYHTVVARPKDLSFPKYHAYLFQSLNWKSQIQSLVNGVKVYSIGKGHLKNSYLLLPPLAEQEKIVSYLDSKTSKIDSYVADKEKEIRLLQELKQKTIAEAVTKGLNPNAKMKDSGISWIGMIPEHWEVKRAKYMFIKNKRNRRPDDEVITCFRDGQVTLRKNRRLTGFTESEKYDGYQGIRKGDLVIHQMDAFAGSIGVSDSDGMGTSVYHCCTPIGDYNVYYYAFLIRQMALSGFIQSLYKGIRERSSDFSFPVFGNQYLVIPPRTEQNEIVANIEEKCHKIDTLITELQAEIDYLKEYKQRLIADVVTGQVNVQIIAI